mmetsp:Transcript_39112/g.83320  ORF Transcript_39112/g.83320 Transcript_39112/m.83320 type:complete len:221 (+) Transcript_39112:1037-1699(+)
MDALALVRLAVSTHLRVGAAIVVICMPNPCVVKHHIVTVDFHENVAAHYCASLVLESTHSHEDVGEHTRGPSSLALAGCYMGAPSQEWPHRRGPAHRGPSLDQKAGDAHVGEATLDLNGWVPSGGNEGGEADAKHNKALRPDDDGTLQAVDARGQQQTSPPCDALVDILVSVARPCDEDLILHPQPPIDAGAVVPSGARGGCVSVGRHIDVPSFSIVLLH